MIMHDDDVCGIIWFLFFPFPLFMHQQQQFWLFLILILRMKMGVFVLSLDAKRMLIRRQEKKRERKTIIMSIGSRE